MCSLVLVVRDEVNEKGYPVLLISSLVSTGSTKSPVITIPKTMDT